MTSNKNLIIIACVITLLMIIVGLFLNIHHKYESDISNKEYLIDNTSRKYIVNDNPFGVFFPIYSDSKDLLKSAKELGIQKTRIPLYWGKIEPKRGEYDFSFFDLYIDKLNESNIMPVVTIKSISSWGTRALTGEDYETLSTSRPPKNMKDYENFLKTVVNRYKGKVKYWQIENELYAYSQYWSGSNEEYLDLLKHAYKTIKKIDPDSKVVLQGFANRIFLEINKGNKEAIDFFNYLMSNDEYFDIIDFHQYFKFDSVYLIVETLKNAMQMYGYNKPIICTEAGGFDLRFFKQQIDHTQNPAISEVPIAKTLLLIPEVSSQLKKYLKNGLTKQEWIDFGTFLKTNIRSGPVLEKYQSEDLIKRISLTLSQGVEFVEWVPMLDFKKPTLWYFSYMGLVDTDGRKKPHFHSYKLLIDKLKDVKSVEELSFDSKVIKFTLNNGKSIFVAWSDNKKISLDLTQYISTSNVKITHIVTELDSNQKPIYLPNEIKSTNYVEIDETPIFVEELRND